MVNTEKYYSLRYILTNLYFDEILDQIKPQERRKQLKALISKETSEEGKFNILENNGLTTDTLSNIDDYVKTKRKKLFDSLDILFTDYREKLKHNKRYKFSALDADFIELLLDNPKATLQLDLFHKKKLAEMDSDFLKLLLFGIRNLINNPFNSLDIENVNYFFRRLLNKEYNLLIEQTNIIIDNFEYFYSSYEHTNHLDIIMKILSDCSAEIFKLLQKDMTIPDVDLDKYKILKIRKKIGLFDFDKKIFFHCNRPYGIAYNILMTALAKDNNGDADQAIVFRKVDNETLNIEWETTRELADIDKIVNLLKKDLQLKSISYN